jgi:hypothetical protein
MLIMNLLEQIQQNLLRLPPEKQSQVLDFVLFLQGRSRIDSFGDDLRQKKLRNSLQHLASLETFSDIPDPSGWQQEIRKDRTLPGRE